MCGGDEFRAPYTCCRSGVGWQGGDAACGARTQFNSPRPRGGFPTPSGGVCIDSAKQAAKDDGGGCMNLCVRLRCSQCCLRVREMSQRRRIAGCRPVWRAWGPPSATLEPGAVTPGRA
uniref:Uncharacterized protein n=1 Tax=Prymnesium polylepis TaxID=72548 RepID=A0A6T7XJL3_9EUKA